MQYSLACQCGRDIPVSASAAGSEVECRCGRSLEVPPLSDLRSMAGKSPYATSIIDTIEGMIRNGALPHGETCVVSGQPTEDTVILRVQCERAWARGPRLDAFDRTIIGFFLLSWIGAIVGWCRRDKSSKDIGHERHVDVPLRVRADLQEQFRRKGPKAMKAMLRQVPVYDALLNEYPEAAVEVLSAGGSRNGL